ncbi:hypothetical protein FHR70_003793 [Microvirga lupini]|uniref:Uncharacterized protein n=1 Tax=Microvirga lupini TaxID=420324 RepID=A0A7W4YXL7_9HYPH|nr:hypothetical protein [Microvirga lupini]
MLGTTTKTSASDSVSLGSNPGPPATPIFKGLAPLSHQGRTLDIRSTAVWTMGSRFDPSRRREGGMKRRYASPPCLHRQKHHRVSQPSLPSGTSVFMHASAGATLKTSKRDRGASSTADGRNEGTIECRLVGVRRSQFAERIMDTVRAIRNGQDLTVSGPRDICSLAHLTGALIKTLSHRKRHPWQRLQFIRLSALT